VNEKGKVFDVQGGIDAENRNIMTANRNTDISQQWDVIYADEYPADPVKGELNEDFGLYVERNFYIVSEMPGHRYVQNYGGNIAIKTHNNRKSEIWYFDQKTLTVRTRENNRCLNIEGNGRSPNNLKL